MADEMDKVLCIEVEIVVPWVFYQFELFASVVLALRGVDLTKKLFERGRNVLSKVRRLPVLT